MSGLVTPAVPRLTAGCSRPACAGVATFAQLYSPQAVLPRIGRVRAISMSVTVGTLVGKAQASSLYNLFYYGGSSAVGWLGGVAFDVHGWPAFGMTIVSVCGHRRRARGALPVRHLMRANLRRGEVRRRRKKQRTVVLQRSIDDVLTTRTDIEWAVSIRDAGGNELACRNGDHVMKTASVGKLLLLVEVARQCVAGELSGSTSLERRPELVAADSGLWQHLHARELAIEDICVLIASVSDNAATNVLLERIGLPQVGALAQSLGLIHTALLDYVRDHRGPDHPPTLSTGSASELSRLMSQLSRRDLVSPAVSEQVNNWLATGVDLSLVASAFGFDPLAHARDERNMFVQNKTGADAGVRADVGIVGRGETRLSYAVIANWEAVRADLRDGVMTAMNAIGGSLRSLLGGE